MALFSFDKVPTVTLDMREDWCLAYRATNHYAEAYDGLIRRFSTKLLFSKIGRLCDVRGGFESKKPVEFSGPEANLMLCAVRSLVRHELIEDDSYLRALGTAYAQLMWVGLDLIDQAAERCDWQSSIDFIGDSMPSELVS
ncbi:MAG TPA: hypothetical protein VIH90_05100 [Candidatus Saccharimonadales bacterium]